MPYSKYYKMGILKIKFCSVIFIFNSCFMLRQHLKNKFRAIQLSVPTAIAHFRVVHRNADGNVVDTRDYNIDLNSGRQSFF